jgi:hypothetical protein
MSWIRKPATDAAAGGVSSGIGAVDASTALEDRAVASAAASAQPAGTGDTAINRYESEPFEAQLIE